MDSDDSGLCLPENYCGLEHFDTSIIGAQQLGSWEASVQFDVGKRCSVVEFNDPRIRQHITVRGSIGIVS